MDELKWAEGISDKIKKKVEVSAKRSTHKVPSGAV